MSTAEIISLIAAVASAAVAFGSVLATSRNLGKQLDEVKKDLKETLARFGERLGRVEAGLEVMRAIDDERSRPHYIRRKPEE